MINDKSELMEEIKKQLKKIFRNLIFNTICFVSSIILLFICILEKPINTSSIIACSVILLANTVFTLLHCKHYKISKEKYNQLIELEDKANRHCPYFVDSNGNIENE